MGSLLCPISWGSTPRRSSPLQTSPPCCHQASPQPGQRSQRGRTGHPEQVAPWGYPLPWPPQALAALLVPPGEAETWDVLWQPHGHPTAPHWEHSPSDCAMATRLPAATLPPLALAARDINLAAMDPAVIPALVKPRAPRAAGIAAVSPASESSSGDAPADTCVFPGCKTLSPGSLLRHMHPPAPKQGACGGRAPAGLGQPGAEQVVQGPRAKPPQPAHQGGPAHGLPGTG